MTEMEIVHQIERMNVYPPKLFWLSNLLEKRPESLFIYKTINNIFEKIDTSKFSQNSRNIYIFLIICLILFFYKIFCDQKKS